MVLRREGICRMSLSNQGSPVTPGLRSILDSEKVNTWADFNCVKVGVVQSFNLAAQSVTVQLVQSMVIYNTPMTGSAVPANPSTPQYPLLVDVPVFVLCGGGGYISMPITAGDIAVVLFNDRDLDPWWSAGVQGAPPNTARTHSLADGIALVGLRPATNPIAGLSTTDAKIAKGATALSLDGAKAGLTNGTYSLLDVLTSIVAALTDLNGAIGSHPATANIATATTQKNSLFK